MANKLLEPRATGLRKPTDAAMQNGNIHNQPRYADIGGLDGPRKCAHKSEFSSGNPFNIVKPGGRK
jgi:hypothetical protein